MIHSLIGGVTIGVVMLITSLILKYSPVKRNPLFGYRTPRSLKNVDNWAFANKLAATYLLYLSLFSISLGTLSIIWGFDTKIIVFTTILLLVLIIIVVEIKLYKFDKSNKKNNDNKSF